MLWPTMYASRLGFSLQLFHLIRYVKLDQVYRQLAVSNVPNIS